MFLQFCDSISNNVCVNPQFIEVNESVLNYLDQYTGFSEEFYIQGFMSVITLFIAGLSIGILINQVRKLR